MSGPVRLDVYVESGCSPCQRAEWLAREIDREYPEADVRIIDIRERDDADIFAVPTFVLNGEVFSLGNPWGSELRRSIERLLRPRG